MQRFENKTVIVTGAGGGMGVSHVRAYHAEGANVVIADRDTERGAALAAELGQRAVHVPLDITSEASGGTPSRRPGSGSAPCPCW